RTLGTGFLFMLLVSAVITVTIYLLKNPILRSFGANEETFQYANDYLNIIVSGVVFMTVGFLLNNVIRSEGNARIAMVSMLLSSVTNVVLDYLFIFKFNMGVKGAAYATIISMF